MTGSGPHFWPVQRIRTRFFRPDSTVDNWGDPDRISKELLLMLDEARSLAGIPFKITSALRQGDTSHSRGTGVDISAPTSRQRFLIVKNALGVGFTRIGVYDLHIHLDVDQQSAPEVIWSGKSQ